VVLNLINPSRAQSTGNQIYPSGRDRQLTARDSRLSSALGGDRDSKYRADASGHRDRPRS
jgi:hypothetical protein